MKFIEYETHSWVANKADPTHCRRITANFFPLSRSGAEALFSMEALDHTWGYQLHVSVAKARWYREQDELLPKLYLVGMRNIPRKGCLSRGWLAEKVFGFLEDRKRVKQMMEAQASLRRYE